jgi:predicted RNase H-like HicB family nuclease
MRRYFTLEYWMDDGWYVGRVKEVPGVFSQGESFDELEDNVQDAYRMILGEEDQRQPLPVEP